MNVLQVRQAHERGYRSAWADAEHMRLAEFRSPWDETVGPVEHAPLPADQDPWLLPAPQQAERRDAA